MSKIGFTLAAKQAVSDDGRQLVGYFLDLENNLSALRDFPNKWDQLKDPDILLEAKQLSIIIHRTARTISSEEVDEDLGNNICDHIEANLDLWTSRAEDIIDNFSSQQLANSLWAFARMDIMPENDFLDVWENQAVEIMTTFQPQHLANSLWACAKLEAMPSPAFFAGWKTHAIHTMGDFEPQHLANSMYAFGRLGVQPGPTFLKTWFIHANENISNFEDRHIRMIRTGTQALGIDLPPSFEYNLADRPDYITFSHARDLRT